MLFSDRLPRASQLSQKLGFQLSFALLVKKAASSHSVRFDFCVSARACERACAHVEVNTSNLGLKERSVFCSRPSTFRPTTTDVHLDDSAAEVQEGETRRSAPATGGHAGGEINYCSRRLRDVGPAVALLDAHGLPCCAFRTGGICRRR